MAVHKFDQQILLTFLLVSSAAVLIWKLLLLVSRKSQHPPGPWRLPVVGSVHHLLAGGQLPHRRLRDLAREHGPLMYLQLGQIPTVVVSSPDVAREVMKTHDRAFASRPPILAARVFAYGCRDVVCAPYGEYWRTMKKMCVLELLSARRVMSYRRIREEEVSVLVESITSSVGCAVDLSAKFFALSNAVVSRTAIGSSNKHQDRMLACMEENLRVASGLELADLFPAWESALAWLTGINRVFTEVFRNMDAVLSDIIKEHMAKSAARADKVLAGGDSASRDVDPAVEEDLLDLLLRHYVRQDLGFQLSINDIKAVILDIFLAGTDTSGTTMEWAMSELMRHPEAMDKAQSEARRVFRRHGKLDDSVIDQLRYLKLVVKETLRLHPPVPLLVPRECMESSIVQGRQIQPGTRVIVNVWALGRDPKHWDAPDEFKPERFLGGVKDDGSGPVVDYKGSDFRFLPFGAGRRMCPGASFGLAVVELALAKVLCHFDWQLPEGVKCVDMQETFGSTASRKVPLCLVPTNY